MNPVDRDETLAAMIERELKQLPDLVPPAGFAERVTARAVRWEKQWWRQPWIRWPEWARAVSLSLMLLMVGGLVAGFTLWWEFPSTQGMAASARDVWPVFVPIWELAWTLVDTLGRSLESMQRAWWMGGGVVAALMYTFCLCIGTACFHIFLHAERRK